MRTSEPCLCGDPECPRCFPGNDAEVRKAYRRALREIAGFVGGDSYRETEVSYVRRQLDQIRAIARDTLEHYGE